MEEPKYIYAGWLIDGSGGPLLKNVLLTIIEGRFAVIETYDKGNGPDSALITDLSHCTILPPLVDSHVHLSMSGTVDRRARQKQRVLDYEDIQPVISQHIHYNFIHGVFGVRDGGDSKGHVLRYKTDNSGGGKDPVILKVSGKGWHQKGRYGSWFGRFPKNETLPAAFLKEKDLTDQIKLVNSGTNSLKVFGNETPPQFTLDEMKEIVRLAEKQGKKVMVHANGEIPVRAALEARCHSIEHGYFMGRENLELMAEKKVIWVPTVFAMQACLENIKLLEKGSDPKIAEKNLNYQLEQITMARECGVNIALGTDSGSFGVIHGESVVKELKLFIKAGLSLSEAIRSATYNGAQLLGIDDYIGVIAKGKPANFIVARGGPSQLPRKLSYLEAIYTDGSPCKKEFFHKY